MRNAMEYISIDEETAEKLQKTIAMLLIEYEELKHLTHKADKLDVLVNTS